MANHIILDPLPLTLIAQQLQSRMVDPVALGAELLGLVERAAVSPSPAVVRDLVLELRSYGRCRGRVHAAGVCDCRVCRINREVEGV